MIPAVWRDFASPEYKSNTTRSTHKRFEVATMNIKPIHTKRDYKAALKSVEGLMNARAGSPEGDRLDILVTLIQAYEAKHFPLLPPSPVEGEFGP